ncbi:MAG TPA: hypothetical protein VMX17_02960 [Candidatus Glassbacteria bacterium]|nr:hypothetical protein [Candidatus Glassbacteria bacterium]
MIDKPEIVIDGLKIVSPCAKCFFHIQEVPKKNCEACKVCTVRVEYDKIVSLGWVVIPWVSSDSFKKAEAIRTENQMLRNKMVLS